MRQVTTAGVLVLVLLVLFAAGAAYAGDAWGGPGWYMISVSPFGAFIEKGGPYASEAACKADLPGNSNDFESYICEYLDADIDE